MILAGSLEDRLTGVTWVDHDTVAGVGSVWSAVTSAHVSIDSVIKTSQRRVLTPSTVNDDKMTARDYYLQHISNSSRPDPYRTV